MDAYGISVEYKAIGAEVPKECGMPENGCGGQPNGDSASLPGEGVLAAQQE